MADDQGQVARTPSGLGIDAAGRDDPTTNVLQLVEAAVQRLDDLRIAEVTHRIELTAYRDKCGDEREGLNKEIRKAETARIDAIRAVDVGAVSRAAEVSQQQASTLAAQVATSAETLRGQVAAAATAQTIALAAALEPIQKAIEDLRRAQYEQQGQKFAQTESRGVSQWAIGFALSAGLALLSLAGFVILLVSR